MKVKSFISKILVSVLSIGIISSSLLSTVAYADSFKVVTLGANLTESQKEEMLKYFNVTKNDANVIEITSKEEYDALGKVATSAQLGNKSISCSYVEPTTSGGLTISTNNLTWVTDGMIRNALITAGVEHANVVAAAPFKVSGTAALTGILKGFENSSAGETISEDKKEAANEEIVVTGDLGDKIGQDDATNLINDIKTNVIKKQPSSDKELDKIVDKSVKDYDNQLSDEDIASIKALMKKINKLDLDYNSLKDQLNNISEQLKDKVTSAEAQGFFKKIGKFFSDIWDAVKGLFSSNDSSNDTTNNSNVNTNKEETSSKDTNSENNNTSNTNEETSNIENASNAISEEPASSK